MSACEIVDPGSLGASDHPVQFYGFDPAALGTSVGRFILAGLQRGEDGVLIAQPVQRRAITAFLERAGLNVESLMASGTLHFFDAEETLDRFLVGGQPDADRFDRSVGSIVRTVLASGCGLRAYGDMVDVLWQRRQYPAAIRLEQLWHRLLAAHAFSLFCGYRIDLLDPDLEIGTLDALLCAHTHLLCSGTSNELATALAEAMDEFCGDEAPRLRRKAAELSVRGWSGIAQTEALILYLRKMLPDRAPQILRRAKALYHAAHQIGPGGASTLAS